MTHCCKTPAVSLVIVFATVCVISAIALIYTKHESRKLFVELETLTHQRDELNIEWGQLQIEQSTWATHSRIEQVATEDLSLVRPTSAEILRNRTAMTRGAETKTQTARRFVGRVTLVCALFGAGRRTLVARAVHLQVLEQEFLTEQADTPTPAYGKHYGAPRHDYRSQRRAAGNQHAGRQHLGEPERVGAAEDRIPQLARALGIDEQSLMRRRSRSA